MTAPTPEQLEQALAILEAAEAAGRDSLHAGVAATVEQPLRHASAVWADETCAEDDGLPHDAHKGGFVLVNDWEY